MATPTRVERVTVGSLLQWAREGRIRIPVTSRAFCWSLPERLALLESIERGYPIGALLLWKRPASAAGETMPLIGAPARPTEGDLYLVVDGHQRVVTLWDALGRPPETGEDGVVFDPSEEQFHLRPQPNGDRSGVDQSYPPLPLHLAPDAAALSEWMPPDLPRDIKRRYFEVSRRLLEHSLPVYIVESDDVEVLLHVVERMNLAGTTIASSGDLFRAVVGSRVVAGVELVNEQIRPLDFGALDQSTILRALEAIRGEAISDGTSSEAELLRAAEAMRASVRFLRERAFVPHASVAPYDLPLIVLARFFSLFERPAERNLVLLRRWLWRGTVTEQFSGASIQQHVDDVTANDEHGSVQALLRRTGAPTPPARTQGDVEPFSVARARGKMIVCALMAHNPRDLLSGEKLRANELFERGLSGLPRSIVPPRGAPLGRGLANRLLHPQRGVSPARLISDSLDEGALASHGIDFDAQRALRAGDVTTFLTRRAAVLDRWTHEFFERQAEWLRDDTPSVLAFATRRTGS